MELLWSLVALAVLDSLLDDKKASPQLAFAQTTGGGSWLPVSKNTSVIAINAVLTYTRQILYVAGSGFCINTEFGSPTGTYNGRVLNLASGADDCS